MGERKSANQQLRVFRARGGGKQGTSIKQAREGSKVMVGGNMQTSSSSLDALRAHGLS